MTRDVIPATTTSAELIVRRSRFIATASRVSSRSDVDTFLRDQRSAHPTASHVVYAFVIGSERSRTEGMSDDGEPHGTAGRPVLDILRGSGVTDCLITVTRYFGGTKLGTGGLVRAYGDAARECLQKLPTEERRILVHTSFSVPYEIHRETRDVIEIFDGVIVSEVFEGSVQMVVGIDADQTEAISSALRDVSRGTIDPCFT